MTSNMLSRSLAKPLDDTTELYKRDSSGRLLPRLGFAGDFMRSVNIIQVNQQVQINDTAPIVEALKTLPQNLHRRALVPSYQAIINSFATYTHHNLPSMLIRTIELTTEKSPDFRMGLEDELQATDPSIPCYKQDFDKSLRQLKSAGNAYAVVLSLSYHALTICSPETAASETTILGQIDDAIFSLRQKLVDTLTPDGCIKDSLLLATLIKPKDERFERYLPYCPQFADAAGFQQLIARANEERYESRGVRISAQEASRLHAQLAETLIELIKCFESLRTARLTYSGLDEDLQAGTSATAIYKEL